jgi:hypothetical protein
MECLRCYTVISSLDDHWMCSCGLIHTPIGQAYFFDKLNVKVIWSQGRSYITAKVISDFEYNHELDLPTLPSLILQKID